MTSLRVLVRRMPDRPEVLEAAGIVSDGVAEAVRQHSPLLLAMSLNPELNLPDCLLLDQALPVLRTTHRPPLVPRDAPCECPPRRVLVAVDGEPFVPNAASRALAPLLTAWSATFTIAHVHIQQEQRDQAPSWLALADVRASGLLPAGAPLALHEESNLCTTSGVLQAVADIQADLLLLIARPRSFSGELFHRGVTAAVLRH